MDNWKRVQSGLRKLGVEKTIEVGRLSKGRYKENIVFLQWFKMFFDANTGGRIHKSTASGHVTNVGSARRRGPESYPSNIYLYFADTQRHPDIEHMCDIGRQQGPEPGVLRGLDQRNSRLLGLRQV